MRKVNNKNGVELYYDVDLTYPKFIIYDSRKCYFNDLILRTARTREDIDECIKMLEDTDLVSMGEFFGFEHYTDVAKLMEQEQIDNPDNNDYINIFYVNKQKEYLVME